VGGAETATGAVDSSEIAAHAVGTSEIAIQAVGADQLDFVIERRSPAVAVTDGTAHDGAYAKESAMSLVFT
jgi:hypothetical protein